MTKRCLLRSLIIAIASIVLAITLAFAYCFISEETRAFNTVLKSAEQGNADAQFKLGAMFYDGDGATFGWLRKQDYSQAAKWFGKSAEQGNVDAQSCFGWMYIKGEGVAQDCNEAVRWYRKAAEQGDTDAQHNLGVMLADCNKVPQDYVEAYKWTTLAAEQGDQNTVEKIDALKNKMSPQQIDEAQKLAKEFKPHNAK
jgi:uncharacterized protein